VFGRRLPQRFQKTVLRQDNSHVARHRFQDDGRQILGVKLHGFFQRGDVIVRQAQGQVSHRFRNSRRSRNAQCRDAGAGLDEQRIGMAVVAAVKFDDHVSARAAAGQANRRHGGFRSGTGHSHPLHRGNGLANQPGHFRFRRRGRAEAGSPPGGIADGRNHVRVGVSENHRPPGKNVVDVFFSVQVIDFAACGALNKQRVAADRFPGAHRRINAAGNDPGGLGKRMDAVLVHQKYSGDVFLYSSRLSRSRKSGHEISRDISSSRGETSPAFA